MSAIADILALVNSNPTKTLDELFLEHLGLGATDVPLKVIFSETQRLFGELTLENAFQSSVNGTARLMLMVNDTRPMYENLSIEISGNDGTISSSLFASPAATAQYGQIRFDFNIKKDVEYTLRLKHLDTAASALMYIKDVKICGSITDPSLII